MTNVIDRFLNYVTVDTQSKEDMESVPSTEKQLALAKILAKELESLGASEVRISSHGYVYATIPATTDKKLPVLGFVSHMDTSPAYSGTDVKPQIHKQYQGGGLLMNPETQLRMTEEEFPDLAKYRGQDLIATDGSTLLGADDKAGVAEIMTMAEYLLSNPQIPHGTIKIGFTPDEEVGRGTDFFEVEGFGADVAYTVDGGELGELEYENFNAASAKVTVHGSSIHPGSSKGRMRNSVLMAMELQSMLPVFDNPMYTEGYEGFYHLDGITGTVEHTQMNYIIRDHDMKKFREKKAYIEKAIEFLNQKYGNGTFTLDLKDSYFNMKEKLEPFMYLIDIAKESMVELEIEPKIRPIRGGTDGARLSYMGLPCPNLCTGGHNFHGKYEFISIQSMEKVVELLIRIVENVTKSIGE